MANQGVPTLIIARQPQAPLSITQPSFIANTRVPALSIEREHSYEPNDSNLDSHEFCFGHRSIRRHALAQRVRACFSLACYVDTIGHGFAAYL
jgi:hypothetical protein